MLAYSGDLPVGIVAIETAVDNGIVRHLWVSETMRRRGIGAALVAAARQAAHTRGARKLYARGNDQYLGTHGFVVASPAEAAIALRSFFHVDELSARPEVAIWTLDLSRDGIIER